MQVIRAENNIPVEGYPEDFEGCIRFCEDLENTPRPQPEQGNLIASAIYEQFVQRHFPEELHWLGHQLIRSLALPSTLKTMQIDPPLPMAQEIIPKMLAFILWHKDTFEDDPPRSFIEMREEIVTSKEILLNRKFVIWIKNFLHNFRLYTDDPKFTGCPFHSALPRYEGENEFKPDDQIEN